MGRPMPQKPLLPLYLLLTVTGLTLATMLASAQVTTTAIDGLRSKPQRFIAYINCTAYLEPGKRLDSAVIIVRDERIVQVGKGLAIPQGATVRNLRGATVYPGFIDPLVDEAALGGRPPYKPSPDDDEGPATPAPIGAHHWNQAVRPEHTVLTSLNVSQDQSREWQKNGWTTLGVVSADGIFRGSSSVIHTIPGTAADVVFRDGAYQALSFRKGSSKTPYPSSQMGAIALLRQTFLDADWYRRAHDVARKNASIAPPETNISLRALADALNVRIPWVAECQDEHDIQRWKAIASEAGIDIILKGSGREYRRPGYAGTYAGKPIILPLQFPDVPDVRDARTARRVSLSDLLHWYAAADNARIVDSLGGKVCFTTDGLKDKSTFLKALRTVVERGLDTADALAAITTVPAEVLGVADRTGRIAPKMYANLVITSGDLFSEETTILTVVTAGRETEFTSQPEIDIRGHWTLTSPRLRAPLILSFEGTSLSPSSSVRSDSIRIASTLRVEGSNLTMTVKLDTVGLPGTTRLTATADSILMNASLVLEDGSTTTGVLRRDSTLRAAPTPAKPTITQRRVLPNVVPMEPFGVDSLAPRSNVVLTGATVWTSGPQGKLENAWVSLAGGKITGVGTGTPPAGPSIDCSGKHITPGIIDEHSHIAITRGVNEGTHAVTTEVRIGDVLDPDDINIYRQLAGGVTSSHLLHGSANPMGGQLQFIKLLWGTDAEGLRFENAKPTVKFALGENVKQANWGDDFTIRYPQTRMGVEEIMRDAFQAAAEYERALSMNDQTKLPVRKDLQLDALVEILRSKRNIHCHSYVQSEILMLMRLAESFGFRVHTFTHILEGYKVAREMAQHGAGGSSFADWWAYKFEVFDAIPESPAIMHEQGVTVSINSDDAEMARRLNQEAAKSVKYGGVSEEDALKFVTINAAKQMAAEDRIGSLEVGKDADLVVWSGHPLSNTSRVERTYVDGTMMFSIEDDARRRLRDAALRAMLEQEALEAIEGGASTSTPRGSRRRMYHCDDMECEIAGRED